MTAADASDRIAFRMRTIRQSLGWSLETAAHKVGTTAVAIGSWERGDRHPSVDRVAHVLATYGHRLAIVGPDEMVVSTKDDGAAGEHLEYVVAYGRNLDGLIDCDTAEEALTIHAHMPHSRIGYRVVRRSAVEYVNALELRRVIHGDGTLGGASS